MQTSKRSGRNSSSTIFLYSAQTVKDESSCTLHQPNKCRRRRATVSGHTLILPPGPSASVSVTLAAASSNFEGAEKRAEKPFAGAMVILVPNVEAGISL
jgi:hypothetical protein